MAKINFEPNIAVEVALKFDKGKEVESRLANSPNQMMYTLCGDDVIYVPLHVAEQITRLGIRREELFSICKRVIGKATKWEVKRLSEATEPAQPPNNFEALPTAIDATLIERQLTTSINQVKAAQALTTPAPAQSTAKSNGTQTPNSNAPIAHTVISKLMASALIAAFDATQECERYAHSKGVEFEFQAEDIRAISNTIFIALSKDPRFGEPQKVNGAGQPWHQ